MPNFDQLLGPLGALIGALALVVILGRLHLQEDERTRARLAKSEDLVVALTAQAKQDTDVNDRAVALAEKAVDRIEASRWGGQERRNVEAAGR